MAAYIRTHPGSVPTVKQHLAAIRVLCDWLVVSQVLPVNPAAAVRGPKHVVTKGATPVLTPAEARKLLEHIDTGTLAGLRDRALFSVMLSSAGLPPSTCCHTFRATGITAYLSNGGTLEHAQQIAGHASPKTTKLYDRTADTVTVDEIERIVI